MKRSLGELDLEPWQMRLAAAMANGAPVKVFASRLGRASRQHMPSGFVPSGIVFDEILACSRREAERIYRAAYTARQKQAAYERFLAEVHRPAQAGQTPSQDTGRG